MIFFLNKFWYLWYEFVIGSGRVHYIYGCEPYISLDTPSSFLCPYFVFVRGSHPAATSKLGTWSHHLSSARYFCSAPSWSWRKEVDASERERDVESRAQLNSHITSQSQLVHGTRITKHAHTQFKCIAKYTVNVNMWQGLGSTKLRCTDFLESARLETQITYDDRKCRMSRE